MTYTTPRARLRDIEEGDEPAVLALLSDESVIRHMLFPRFTSERARTFVDRARQAREERPRTSLVLGITLRDGGPLIGMCGLLIDPRQESGEAWYLLAPAYWGRGLMTESADVLLHVGFGALRLHRIWATCVPDNPGSARVLEKLGFRREGLLRRALKIQEAWRDAYLYALLDEEWERRPEGPRPARAGMGAEAGFGARTPLSNGPEEP